MNTIVQRFPCGCVIRNGAQSCEHVDAALARQKGRYYAERNEYWSAVAAARSEREAEEKEKS